MRFLLSVRAAAGAAGCRRRSRRKIQPSSSPSAAAWPTTTTATSGGAAAAAETTTWPRQQQQKLEDSTTSNSTIQTHKWGQACAPACGCVLRFELALDGQDKVVESTYIAKRVWLQEQQQQQQTTNQQQPRRPVLTTRHGKLQLFSCNCDHLHRLADTACEYMESKYLWQLQNEFEFSHASSAGVGLRSSANLKNSILQFQNMDIHKSHCLDLVEDAATGALKQFIPAPRRQKQINSTNFSSGAPTSPTGRQRSATEAVAGTTRRHNKDLSESLCEEGGADHPYYDLDECHPYYNATATTTTTTTTTTTASSFASSSGGGISLYWPLSSSEREDDDDDDDDGHTTERWPRSPPRRWTALDWIDHHHQEDDELYHEKKDKEVDDGQRVTDWLSYVDRIMMEQQETA